MFSQKVNCFLLLGNNNNNTILEQSNKLTKSARTRRTQSFGGFLQRQQVSEDSSPFRLLLSPGSVSTTSSVYIRHTSTSPVRTCSSVDNTLNVGESGISSASYIRLFPYLNRSASIDQNQTLRSGQSCPQVRCDIVEYL